MIDRKIIGKIGDQTVVKVIRGSQIDYMVCKDYEKSDSWCPKDAKWFWTFEDAMNFIYKKRYDYLYSIVYVPPASDMAVSKNSLCTVVKGKRGVWKYLISLMEKLGFDYETGIPITEVLDGKEEYRYDGKMGRVVVKKFTLGNSFNPDIDE